jgi:histidinol-phosphate/aromatic aminotransferase/cobyric acid decarboxylase-like protein
MVACATPEAVEESERRARVVTGWRRHLSEGLDDLGVSYVRSAASFVLVEVGEGVHGRLRDADVAVRRADTFPGLGPSWVRIAVRPPEPTQVLLEALQDVGDSLLRPRADALE